MHEVYMCDSVVVAEEKMRDSVVSHIEAHQISQQSVNNRDKVTY